MSSLKIIKTESEYERALARVDELMDATPDTPEMDELELLTLLVETYEDEHYPMALPDPIDAIMFRMEQQGLTRKDMQAYLGSQARVSEVLNRKRPLSKEMMRRLHEGLGIPAEVLLQEPGRTELEPNAHNPSDYPLNTMLKRGYLTYDGTPAQARAVGETLLDDYLAVFKGQARRPAYCRRSDRPIDLNALEVWQARALYLANEQQVEVYEPGSLDENWLRDLMRLSVAPLGPLRIADHLAAVGIHFVVLEHLDRTYLDGASFLAPDGHPVIGLTLRFDRADNFWFALAHELAHVVLHLRGDAATGRVYFDELEGGDRASLCDVEAEADTFATNLLIPRDVWAERSAHLDDPLAVLELAAELSISPAIVAGRVRWERGDYALHGELVGQGQIRLLFRASLCDAERS